MKFPITITTIKPQLLCAHDYTLLNKHNRWPGHASQLHATAQSWTQYWKIHYWEQIQLHRNRKTIIVIVSLTVVTMIPLMIKKALIQSAWYNNCYNKQKIYTAYVSQIVSLCSLIFIRYWACAEHVFSNASETSQWRTPVSFHVHHCRCSCSSLMISELAAGAGATLILNRDWYTLRTNIRWVTRVD